MSDGGREDFRSAQAVSEETCLVMKDELSFFPFMEQTDMADVPCYFEMREVKRGDMVCRERDPCDYVAFIVSGKLEIKKETEFQGKEFILGIYGKGSIVGELCIIDGAPRAVSALALEDSSLVVITRSNFEKMLQERPALGVKFLKGLLLTVSIRLRKSFDRLASIF